MAVLSKVHPIRSHSGAAQGGINAALGNAPEGRDDSPQRHAFDTIKGRDYLADQGAVAEMCALAPEAIRELEHSAQAVQPVSGRHDRPAPLRRRGLSPRLLMRPTRPATCCCTRCTSRPSDGASRSTTTRGHAAGRARRPLSRPDRYDLRRGAISEFRLEVLRAGHRGLRPAQPKLHQCADQHGQRHRHGPVGRRRRRTWSSCSSIPPRFSGPTS